MTPKPNLTDFIEPLELHENEDLAKVVHHHPLIYSHHESEQTTFLFGQEIREKLSHVPDQFQDDFDIGLPRNRR